MLSTLIAMLRKFSDFKFFGVCCNWVALSQTPQCFQNFTSLLHLFEVCRKILQSYCFPPLSFITDDLQYSMGEASKAIERSSMVCIYRQFLFSQLVLADKTFISRGLLHIISKNCFLHSSLHNSNNPNPRNI